MNDVSASTRLLAALLSAIVGAAIAAWAPVNEEVVVTTAAQARTALPMPALHHAGLNVADPARSQQFYKTVWPQGEITTFAGLPAYKSNMYLLFTKVNKPAGGVTVNLSDTHRTCPTGAAGCGPCKDLLVCGAPRPFETSSGRSRARAATSARARMRASR